MVEEKNLSKNSFDDVISVFWKGQGRDLCSLAVGELRVPVLFSVSGCALLGQIHLPPLRRGRGSI